MAIANFYRGDTKKYKFTFTDDSGVIDITGWKLWLTLKSDLSLTDVQAELQISATSGDDTDDDEGNGIMHLTLTSTATKVLVPGQFHYDVQRTITGAPADVVTVEKGKTKVLEDVTITDT